jgi:Ca2+-binding RTX toxin-like protein
MTLARMLRPIVGLALVGMIGYGMATVTTAGNVVPASHAGRITDTITPDKLKPAACAGLTLTSISIGAGKIPGTAGNDLILGSAGNDTLGSNAPNQGTDCCVGGGGADTFLKSCAVSVP